MTELSETHKQFISALFALNKTMEELFASGNVALFTEMNAEIKELHRLQSGSEDPVMKALAVLRTTEDGTIDAGAQSALNKFLHNIDEAVVNIASALGVV